MKFRLTVILLLLLVLFTAFSLGCGEDELSAQEVLAKSIKATTESNSTVFEMDTEQIIEMPGVPGMVSKTVATGKSIKEPLAVEIEMQTDMGDMQIGNEGRLNFKRPSQLLKNFKTTSGYGAITGSLY